MHQLTTASAIYFAEGRWWKTIALLESPCHKKAAMDACASLSPHAQLTTIHSPQKNRHVSALLTAGGKDGWLGMTTWLVYPYGYWDDKSPLYWTNWDTVTFPQSPEPNGKAKDGLVPVDAVAVNNNGLWYDTASQLQLVPLCDQEL